MQTLSSDENNLSVRLSVRPMARPSVWLSNACIVAKRKKNRSEFLYQKKKHLTEFSEKKNGWWGRPLLPEIVGQTDRVGAKSPILKQCSLVAPEP